MGGGETQDHTEWSAIGTLRISASTPIILVLGGNGTLVSDQIWAYAQNNIHV